MRSQISVDFLIVAGIVLTIFLFVFSIISNRRDELFESENLYSAKETAEQVASSINTIFLAGDGARRIFYTPDYLRGDIAYILTVRPQDRLVEVRWQDRSYTSTILTSSTVGDLTIVAGQNLVKNNQGVIQITTNYMNLCGNSVIDAGEDCDGINLGVENCISQGYSSGILACNPDCTFDFSGCYTCGNNIAEGTEACDGADLRGESCVSQGYSGGTLACQPSCNAYDTSGCSTQICGNNIAEGTETCDGTDLRGQTCVSQGYSGGALACQPTCNAYDTSGCTTLTTCQQACSSLGFGSWLCRSSCGGSWRNPAPNGNAWCTAQQGLPVCCCR